MSYEEAHPFKGDDGRRYATYEEAIAASEEERSRNFPYIGKDGGRYATYEEMVEANDRYYSTLYENTEIIYPYPKPKSYENHKIFTIPNLNDTELIKTKFINEHNFKNPEPEQGPTGEIDVTYPLFELKNSSELPYIISPNDPKGWLAEGRYDLVVRYIDDHVGNYWDGTKLRSAISEELAKLQETQSTLRELLYRLDRPKWQSIGGFSVDSALDDTSVDSQDPTTEQ